MWIAKEEYPDFDLHVHLEESSGSLSYAIVLPSDKGCVLIDPVSSMLDSGIVALEDKLGPIECVLDTHPHADRLSAGPEFSKKKIEYLCSANTQEIWEIYSKQYNVKSKDLNKNFVLKNGDTLFFGVVSLKVIATPGHTPACTSFEVSSPANKIPLVFVGDTLFAPDVGCARADFPKGDAKALFDSIHRLYRDYPDSQFYLCHDYPKAANRNNCMYKSSCAEQRKFNLMVSETVSEKEFVAKRISRDKALDSPKYLKESLLNNIFGIRL